MKKLFIYLILSPVIMISCQEIFFSGNETSREIILEDFNAVRISGNFNVVLIQDSTNKLMISGKNDVGIIDAFIKDDTLVIDDNKNMSFNPNRNSLVLHFSHLGYIESNKTVNLINKGTIKADNLTFVGTGEIEEIRILVDCNNFQIVNSSNTIGYMHFSGKTNDCWIWNRYGSCMYADSLQCRSATLYNESIGDICINASDYLEASIRSSGNIYYHGNPLISVVEKSGSGRLIHKE